MNTQTVWYALIYLAEALIAWQYAEYLFPRKRSTPVALALLFGTYAVMFLCSLLGNTEVNIASFFLLSFLLFLLTWNVSWKAALLHSALVSVLMSGSEILFSLLLMLFGFEFDAYTTSETVFFALAVGSKLLYFLLTVGTARVFRPHQYGKGEPAVMLLFCVLPLLSVAVVTAVVFVGSHSDWDSATGLVVAGSTLSLLLANMVFAVLYHHLQKSHAEREALLLATQKAQADALRYQALHEQNELRRGLIHDIRRHFRTISHLASENNAPAIAEYMTKLNAEARFAEEAALCSHPVLNMLLLHFRAECEKKQITPELDIREAGEWAMDPADTTVLLGNLLSNATEAAEFSAEKQIFLCIRYERDRGMFVITAKNSCDTPPVPDGNGGFLSRKKNRDIHGMGLRNMERVLKRHHGLSLSHYDGEKHLFQTVIQLPCS